MALRLIDDTDITSIADALRAIGNTDEELIFPGDFISAINNLGSSSSSEEI